MFASSEEICSAKGFPVSGCLIVLKLRTFSITKILGLIFSVIRITCRYK